MTTSNPAETPNAAPPPPADVKPPPAPSRALAPTSNEDTSRAINAFGSDANFTHAQRMAKLLSTSTMVPKAYQGEQGLANCIIALELSARIGASVFMVMQNLDIIQGKPGWRSTFLIATVNASGRFTPLRYEWVGTRGTDGYGCRAYAKDRESGEPCQGAVIDWAMVKAEGWLSKSGSKWKTMPDQMFMYRAAAFWTRVYAPELSLGMQTADEVIDTVGELVGEVITPLRGPSNGSTQGAPPDLEAFLRDEAAKAEAAEATAKAASTNGAQPTADAKPDAKPAETAKPTETVAPGAVWPPCAVCGKPITGQDDPAKTSLGEGKGTGWRHSACSTLTGGPSDGNDKWGMTGAPVHDADKKLREEG